MEFLGSWKTMKPGNRSLRSRLRRAWFAVSDYFRPKPRYVMSADQWFVLHLGATPKEIKTFKRDQ